MVVVRLTNVSKRATTIFATALVYVAAAASASTDAAILEAAEARRELQEVPPTGGVQELRQILMQNYNKFTYPYESVWAENNRTGLDVQLSINFHRVFAVEVTESTTDLIVWMRQVWNDPRLTWDPSEFNNITTMHFWVDEGIGAAETSEIWTPDLHLWNVAEPLASSLASAHAIVSSDGTVFWARPGHLKPACKFEGLKNFPFDTLSCSIEIGSWTHSGLFIRVTKFEEGFSIGGSETAGEAYAEFSLESIECVEYGTLSLGRSQRMRRDSQPNQSVYPPFLAAPNEDWPVLLYTVWLTRAWQPYARGFLMMQVFLNLTGFSSFWLPPYTGERMGLSITALLASVASELVVTEKLPAFGEWSWVTKFSLASLMFTALALLENCIVIYFHYHTGSSLVPRFVTFARRKIKELRSHGSQDDDSLNEGEEVMKDDEVKRRTQSGGLGGATRHLMSIPNDSIDGLNGLGGDDEYDHRPTMVLGRHPDDFKDAKEIQNNERWQRVARTIDDISRVVFPVAYAIYLAQSISQTAGW